MLEAKPNEPTITTSLGLDISNSSRALEVVDELTGHHAPGVLKKRSKASINIEKHKANKNTPLIRAARISALCQP